MKGTLTGLSLALGALLLTAGADTSSAQTQAPSRSEQSRPMQNGGPGMTGAPSSTNPQAGNGLTAPREVPENGGAPHTVVPGPGPANRAR